MAKSKRGKSNQKRKSTPTRKPAQKPAAKKVVKTASPSPEAKKPSPKTQVERGPVQLPFSRMNYILLLSCIGLIVLGFFLMSLEDFIDAREFSIALYVAPPITVLGFVGIIYAIMYRPKEHRAATSGEEG